jgi:hypothetical protein
MAAFDTKEDLLVTIQVLFDNLNTGNLSESDMETLVTSTRELYERALILRYKAYEHKVYGEAPVVVEAPIFHEEHIVVEPVIEVIDTPVVEEPTQTVADEQPSFDMSFSLFDQLEESNDVAADSHAMNEQELIQNNPVVEQVVVEQSVIEEKKIEAVAEEPVATMVENTAPAFSEPVVEAPKGPKDVFDRMLDQDNSLGAKLMATRLESLNGAFGLNEKLQMIHELFDGSSELFYQAIQIFDTLPDFTQAKVVLTNYKQEFSWDLESNLVVEFVQKVARRYA